MAEDEAAYREHFLPSDAKRTALVIAISIFGNVAFIPNDVRLVGIGPPLSALLLVRFGYCALAAVALAVLLRSNRPRAHGQALAGFLASFVLSNLYVASTRPAGFTGHAIVALVSVSAFYFVVAGPVLQRAATSLAISATSAWFLLTGSAAAAETTSLVGAHLLMHLVGFPAARRFEISRRQGFFAHLAEQRARADLAEKARGMELARNRAEASEKAKSNFLALMSHELRTPMNAVLGLSDVLAGTPLSPAQRDMVRSIHGSARSLFTVLANILELASIDAESRSAGGAPFALREVVAGAMEIVRHRASEKALTLELAVAKEVPAALSGDAPGLRLILVHLLSNAVATTEQGAIVVSVSARLHPEGEHEITFAVGHTGIGFSLRAREATLPDLRSGDPGVELPVNRDLRLLLVDDNDLNREVALALLHRLGLGADAADSGRAAIEAVARKAYDVIFMDLRMPELDGIETTRRILALLPEAKRPRVIALSASAFEEDRVACRAAGMVDFLSKPLHLPDLRAALARVAPGGSPAPAVPGDHDAVPAPKASLRGAPPRLAPEALALLKELETADSPGFFVTLCRKFVADADARLDRLASAAASGDAASAEREGHTLKSACATMGASEMSAACAALESAARRADLSGHPAAIEKLRAELSLVEKALAEAAGEPLR